MGIEAAIAPIAALVLGGAGGFAGARVQKKFESDRANRAAFIQAASQQAALGNKGFFDNPEVAKAFKSAGAEESLQVFQAIASADLTQEQREVLFGQLRQQGAAAETGTAREQFKGSLIEEITGRGKELESPAAGFEEFSPEVQAAVIPPAGQVAAQVGATEAGERISKRRLSVAERRLKLDKGKLENLQETLDANIESASGSLAAGLKKEDPSLTPVDSKAIADFFVRGGELDERLRTRVPKLTPDLEQMKDFIGEATKLDQAAFDMLQDIGKGGLAKLSVDAQVGVIRQHNELKARSLMLMAKALGWSDNQLQKKLKENLFTRTTKGIDNFLSFADAEKKGIPQHKLILDLIDFVGDAGQLSPEGQSVLDAFEAGGALP